MLEIFKVPVEPLTAAAFAPFGSVIRTFDEIRPEVRVGGLTEHEYTVTADVSDPPPEKLSLSEGRLRAHFACHDDAGQSFYPTRHCPTVFLVAAPSPRLNPEDLRAFYSDGSLGVCLGLEVWHTMPICLEGTEVFHTARGDQDYQTHPPRSTSTTSGSWSSTWTWRGSRGLDVIDYNDIIADIPCRLEVISNGHHDHPQPRR